MPVDIDVLRITNLTNKSVKFQDIMGEATRLGVYDRITAKRIAGIDPLGTVEILASSRVISSAAQGQLKLLEDESTISIEHIRSGRFFAVEDRRSTPEVATATLDAIASRTIFVNLSSFDTAFTIETAGAQTGQMLQLFVEQGTGVSRTPSFPTGVDAASVAAIAPTFGTGAGKMTHIIFEMINDNSDWIMTASREIV